MELDNRNNKFPASDWFDINFLAGFVPSSSPLKKYFNEQLHKLEDSKLSSRVLNHWYESGIITDDRPNGKGWKKFSLSELVWIQIVLKLRVFGLNLKKIKEVKNQLDYYNSIGKISKCPLLDFYIIVAGDSKMPVKLIVFESGQAELLRQIDIDIANQLDCITEDYISIDINKLLEKLLIKKKIKTDYLSYSDIPKSPIVKQIENSLTANDIQSVTIKVNDKDYLVGEEFFTKDRIKANALMSVLKFGELVEKKNAGKSTYQVTNKKKIKKG
jgi:DNA-binding transcriptional MerR regulator/stalled ribosome alternative rescue factor ArfA